MMSGNETYEKILQTARRLFVQQGYTATSMRQVAAEAGIGKATIYHHFPDKEAIALALLQTVPDRMEETLRIMRAENDPRRRIQNAVTDSIRFLLDSADIIQVIRREVPGGYHQIQAGYQIFFQEYIALLSEAICRGIEQGIFRPVDPSGAARVLQTMVQGTFAMTYLGGGRPQSAEKEAAALLDVFFQGINT